MYVCIYIVGDYTRR